MIRNEGFQVVAKYKMQCSILRTRHCFLGKFILFFTGIYDLDEYVVTNYDSVIAAKQA